ncbi:tRNA (adenosine(37)-N6)-threonylcarbamoyltransferase complex ATPase subunit type 1 TsaE [Shimazuella sp. AN120528]|nr:tRNA (adenosine(37)-N6)-threonylcarbamoyltransferase complex ATPase subunit type 1 TsaE [Shimazuella soli]
MGTKLSKGAVIALSGELGAGKTTFSQGLAKGLGVEEYVDSPTFSILKVYEGRLPLYHMDVYRLEEDSVEELGLDEYLYGDGVSLVEWPSRIVSLLPKETIFIEIEALPTGDRAIKIDSSTLYKELRGL